MNAEPPVRLPCIGVFDSGVGGLTVLRELRRLLPDVALHYIADTAHAPYGQRSSDFIAARSLRLAEHLVDQGAALVVVACNTATAHAIAALRQRWSALPIVGIEPGIKPAVAASRNGRIGVMATPATMSSTRYQELLARHAGSFQIVSQACPGLVDLIEAGEFDSPELRELLTRLCEPLRNADVDTVLMGCTHYPLIQQQLQAELGPKVQLLNNETAVALQAVRLWTALELPTGQTSMRLETTGSAPTLTRFVHRALGWGDMTAEPLSV